jgi:hypothetical protein
MIAIRCTCSEIRVLSGMAVLSSPLAYALDLRPSEHGERRVQ